MTARAGGAASRFGAQRAARRGDVDGVTSIADIVLQPDPVEADPKRSTMPISALFARPVGSSLEAIAVMAADGNGMLELASARARRVVPVAHTELPRGPPVRARDLGAMGSVPVGHPWLKPLRFQPPAPGAAIPRSRPAIGITEFYRIEGEEVHEVAVGPVHVIEPGHLRFQCHGETVMHLEIASAAGPHVVLEVADAAPGRRATGHGNTSLRPECRCARGLVARVRRECL